MVANSLCKGPNSKHFQLCRPSTTPGILTQHKSGHRQYANDMTTFQANFIYEQIFEFHTIFMLQIILLIFFRPLKNVETILSLQISQKQVLSQKLACRPQFATLSPELACSYGSGHGEIFGVYKDTEFTGCASGFTQQVKKRGKWRKFAGFLPEQLTDHRGPEPWSPVILGLSQAPFTASLCNKSNHLALCFKSSSPGTANFSNLASNCHPSPALLSNHHCFPVCRLLFTPPNPFPSVLLCPNPRHPAPAMENATCPQRRLALPAGRNGVPAPLLLFLAPHSSTSICVRCQDSHLRPLPKL